MIHTECEVCCRERDCSPGLEGDLWIGYYLCEDCSRTLKAIQDHTANIAVVVKIAYDINVTMGPGTIRTITREDS